MPLKKQLYLTGGGGDRGVAAVGDDAEKEAEAGGDVGPSATPLASSIKMFSAAAMELGEVLGLQGLTVLSTKEGDLSLIKRAAGNFTQAAAAASYPSLFLDEQKMLRFAKAAHTLPSGLDFGRENEQRFLLSRTKMPFIPSQWMELEHQVLIYKYLNAKAPIPSSLLISISKSFRSSANRMSWRLLYQGFPNAESDPEPGRYRRTNGKKWRCSKEVMADHKYSERHINRNCHRSRKPVENQSRKTVKETPCAGSLPSSVGQGSFKKTKVNEMKPGSISYWTDSLNRNQLYIGHGTCGLIGNGNVLLISNCCASLPLPSARPCSSRRYTTRIFDSVE